jgi:hypothetical protein
VWQKPCKWLLRIEVDKRAGVLGADDKDGSKFFIEFAG